MSFLSPHWRVVLPLAALAACTPTLNWREVRLPQSELQGLFPCKPEHLQRQLVLAGVKTVMHLTSCSAAGATYAIGYADLGDAGRITAALEQLHVALSQNIGARPGAPAPFSVPGMTPHPLAQRWQLQGAGADGKPVAEQAALFTRGLTVYQAIVVGPSLNAEAVDTFLQGMKLAT